MFSTWMKGAVVAGVAISFAAASTFNAGAAEQAAAAAAPAAAAAGPSAVDLLFERKHLGNLDSGQEVVYRFQRTVSDEKLLELPVLGVTSSWTLRRSPRTAPERSFSRFSRATVLVIRRTSRI